jgi:hypothetical protein
MVSEFSTYILIQKPCFPQIPVRMLFDRNIGFDSHFNMMGNMVEGGHDRCGRCGSELVGWLA